MKRGLLLLALMAAIVLVSGCTTGRFSANCLTGSGDVVSEDFDVSSGFESISFDGFGHLYVTQGTGHSLRIEADDNVLDNLNVRVESNTLKIGSTRCFTGIRPVNAYVTMEDVNILSGSGSVSIVSENEISADSLRLDIDGSGKIDMELDVGELVTDIVGSGDAFLDGTAGTHTASIDGSGYVRAFGLSTEKTSIRIAGSGTVETEASQELDIVIEGSGSVFYKGDASVSQNIAGSGRVQKL
jgi:hypothetical protein